MQLKEIRIGDTVSDPMALTLDLAEYGKATVSPNPMVGAVILQNEKLVGYGYHLYKGDKHAEIKAIDMAGAQCKGGKLYINLEPCSHYGATPPCIDAIIHSGISQVHISNIDPNPLVNGKSIKKLKDSGIKVLLGEYKERSAQLNEIFFHYMKTKRPFVIAKWAMTADGKIATAKFDSKWITGEESRNNVHILRNTVDGIIVGLNTIINDNPTLNTHSIRQKNSLLINELPSNSLNKTPLKIIISNNIDSIPTTHNIFAINPERTCLVCNKDYIKKNIKHKLHEKGVFMLEVTQDKNGLFDLSDLLTKLGELSITSLLVEGGGFTLSRFLEANLINKFYCYIAPKFIGGKSSISPFSEDIGVDFIKDAKNAEFTSFELFGNDVLLKGYFKNWSNKCLQE